MKYGKRKFYKKKSVPKAYLCWVTRVSQIPYNEHEQTQPNPMTYGHYFEHKTALFKKGSADCEN